VQTAQARRLRFGPRWQCLRRQRLSRDEALAHLELGAPFAGDLPTYALHPALLDLAAHHGLPLIEGYEGSDPVYVPFSVRRVRVHAPLAPRVVSWVRSRAGNAIERQVAAFDVAVADEQGRVLVELEEFTVRRLAGSDALLAPRTDGAREGGTSRQVTDSERLFLRTYEAGIEAGEGMAALSRVLASDAPPQLVVSSIDLATWLARTEAALAPAGAAGEKFARPNLRSAYEPPRDELERKLADAWQELLGIEGVGIRDDFFELGGHSLIAVRLFARIKHAFGFDEPISVLFQAPTIEQLAALVRERVGDAADGARTAAEAPFKHLVQMTPGDGRRPPFFVVAGMFGNVLNLRHLAVHVGSDQAIYALQARGLYGEDPPHRRFEEAARDYLREVRSVQPEGPYYVGGFSGGGVTAFEMAHQLLEQGEEVGLLVGLDSMPPRDHTLTRRDRLDMLLYDLRRHGPGYLVKWARNRVRWELELRERRSPGEPRAQTPAEFRSEQIEIAFREALDHYRLRVYPGKMLLLRPPPEKRWVLRDGRIVGSNRCFADHYNHWKPWVAGGIDVLVVSGDHDGMVLEPHVRVLAARLRECLDEAQRRKREDQNGGG
jgi:thioesterase domain-containing protein/acyl carrier protein